jgi:hypothetical protein
LIAPIAASASVFPCRVCGEALLYGRVFAISKAFRAAGRHAVKADMICEGCEAASPPPDLRNCAISQVAPAN